MKRAVGLAIVVLGLLPSFVCAAAAGFAPGAVWLSRTSLTAGDTATIYTVLYDSTDAALAGTLAFQVDGSTVSSQQFELGAGESKVFSATWTATAGSHQIAAALRDITDKASNAAVSLDNTAAAPVAVQVASPPPPPVAMQAATQVASAVQEQAPAVIAAGADAFSSAEAARQKVIDALEAQLAAAEASVPARPAAVSHEDGAVLGASTSSLASADAGGTAQLGAALNAAWRAILSGALVVARTQYLFYLAILFVLFILYKLLRTILFENRHPYREYD